MKTPSLSCRSPRANGFTLVELLVVMAIIAILAGILLSAITGAIKTAQRAKMNNLANQIQTAVLGYYTEYSVYPAPTDEPTGKDFVIQDNNAAEWAGLLYGLCGNVNPTNNQTNPVPGNAAPNTRAISFLTLKNSDVDANNGPLNTLKPNANELYFNIAIDYDYDGYIGPTPPGTGSVTANIPNLATATTGTSTPPGGGSTTAGVAVWANCNGATTTINPNFYVHTY